MEWNMATSRERSKKKICSTRDHKEESIFHFFPLLLLLLLLFVALKLHAFKI